MVEKISNSILKVDNAEKTCGQIKYINDYSIDGMLYAKTLRSSRPRAQIISINLPKMPEGYFVVDKSDVPGKNRVKLLVDDLPFFAENQVNYIGEPILLVVGPDRAIILDIISKTEVNYKELEPIYTVKDAMNSSINPIYGADNLFANYFFAKGDFEKVCVDAYKIIEHEFNTGYQEHAYLETQGIMATYENGVISVLGSIQCPYYVKNALVQGLGCGPDDVRVLQVATGGAFGGKEDYPSLIAGQVAVAALKIKKPVKLIFDREEDILTTTKRHPSTTKIKAAVNEAGQILGMDFDIVLDAGAYASLSAVVLQRAMFAITGVYNFQNIKVRGRAYATNNVISGAYRGFGCPQAIFAIEMMMDKIARIFQKNPLEYKQKFIAKKGDNTCTGGMFRDEIILPKMIEEIEKMSNYNKKIKDFKIINNGLKNKKLKGIGISLFLHGCGFTGSGEQDHIKAVVKIKKTSDNVVHILISNAEIGQGVTTTFRKMVSKILSIPIEKTVYAYPDTSKVPDSGPTVASRTLMIVGRLVELAALDLKENWKENKELVITKQYKQPSYVQWNQEKLCGDAYPAYSWGANVVEVEIDKITCEISLKGIWNVFDVGFAVDERIVRGQVEGGMLQGLGFASLEVMRAVNGKLMQKNLTDYIIPTAMDVVNMETKFMDNPYEDGPFGAKGVGELTFVGAPAAFASAVSNALNLEIDTVPITPEYIMEVID